jgi:hypothetical protein
VVDDELVLEGLEPGGGADLAVDAIVFDDEVEAPPISAAGRGEVDTLGSSLFEDDHALEATLAGNSDEIAAALEATAAEPAPAKKPKRAGSLLGRLLGGGKKKKTANPLPAAAAKPDGGAPEAAAAQDVVPDADVANESALPADTFEPMAGTPEDDLELPTGDTPTPSATTPSATTSDTGDDALLDFLAESEAEESPEAPDDPPVAPSDTSGNASEDSAENLDDGFDDLFKDL